MAHHHHPDGDTKEDTVDAWLLFDHDDLDHNHRGSVTHGDGSVTQKHHHHDPVTRLPFSHQHHVLPGEGDHEHMTANGLSSAANHEHPRP